MEGKLRRELLDRVKAYESKLATLNIIHSAVKKENEELRVELEQAQPPGGATDEDLAELKEEFSRRLGSADQTIACLQDEKERLKTQVAAASQNSTANSSQLVDKYTFIATLQEEGLSLAKRNDELKVSVRSLRAMTRDSEAEHQRMMRQVQQLESQLAKEQERYAQASRAAGEQMQELEAQLESAISHSDRQVAAAQRQAVEAIQKAEVAAARGGAEAVAASVERETAMNRNLAGLRAELEVAEASWAQREATLRREVGRLEDQIHGLEAEKAELAVSASEATKPLLRQLESMAAQAAEQQRVTQESELNLSLRLRQAESALADATEAERQNLSQAQRAEVAASLAKQALLKAQVGLQETRSKLHLEQQKTDELQEHCSAMGRQLQAALASANTAKMDHNCQQLTLQAQTQALQQQLKDLRSEHGQLHDRLKGSDSQPMFVAGPVSKPVGRPSVLNGVKGLLQRLNGSQNMQTLLPVSTPSLVIGQQQGDAETPKSVDCQSSASSHMLDDSSSAAEVAGPSKQGGDEWDELLSSVSNSKHSGGKNGTATAGRIANLERRVLTSEAAERRCHTELLKACERADTAERNAAQFRQLEEQMQEQDQRYNTALELLGERNEKVDQLEEDITEMKQIFHEQISVMANQLNATNKA
ncbi:hypothetical protein WJX77_012006 [Trebouxia sp. C0004]